jgi:hypothetical protein
LRSTRAQNLIMIATNSRHILFVLGMHRAGTSALCAALQASGASFGSDLLDPMAGVNDEGFWEDETVVEVNEALLATAGARWYSVTRDHLHVDWAAPAYGEYRRRAAEIVQNGFGNGDLEVVKDPRLCLTLPFWQSVCEESGVATSVCVISRSPMEIARSLEKRDAFPLGYGLRLCLTYCLAIAHHAPPDANYVTYDALVRDPEELVRRLGEVLPLKIPAQGLGSVVRGDLRHHAGDDTGEDLFAADQRSLDPATMEAAIAKICPVETTLAEFATALVERGQKLAEIGAMHSLALATIDERDRQLSEVGGQHSLALATLDERDGQIEDFDRRLSKLGEEHTYALNLIRSRDAQLERVFKTPGVGRLFKAMWKHAAC